LLTNKLIFCTHVHNFFRILLFEDDAKAWPDIEQRILYVGEGTPSFLISARVKGREKRLVASGAAIGVGGESPRSSRHP
jgi:hypothetical protein